MKGIRAFREKLRKSFCITFAPTESGGDEGYIGLTGFSKNGASCTENHVRLYLAFYNFLDNLVNNDKDN